MPKKLLQDVLPTSRPTRRVRPNINPASSIEDERPTPSIPTRRVKRSTVGNGGGSFSRFAIWGVAMGAVLFLVFVLLSFFSGTIVTITPLQKNVTVNGDFRAVKDAGDNNLPFKLMELEHSTSGEVSATIEKDVERKSSGNIIIYNSYSSKTQKLIKRTRFETPDGKIYRIDKSVVVPGTTVQGGEIVPGSVEVTVYADIPGEEFNIGLTDFTIPGFKGDPRFSKFYARSKTPMEDGFSGTVHVASPEDIASVTDELENSLKEILLSQARSQVPGDFILYDDAVFFSFSVPEKLEETTKDVIDFEETGVLYGVLFNKNELSKRIAEKGVATYDGGDVLAHGLTDLVFSVNNREEFNPTGDTEIIFNLSGETTVVWDVDETSLVRDLEGISKIDFLGVIDSYSNIQKAEATLRPFWKKMFPETSDDITIRNMGLVNINEAS